MWINKLESVLVSYKWIFAMSLVTFYVLFMEDVRSLCMPISADLTMDSLYIIAMSLYLFELIAGSIVIENYFLRFFFWVDLISLLSMLPDISFLLTAIDEADSDVVGADKSAAFAKNTATIRVIRIIRIIRLIRLFRLVAAYK